MEGAAGPRFSPLLTFNVIAPLFLVFFGKNMKILGKLSPFHAASLSVCAALVLARVAPAQQSTADTPETFRGEEAVQHLKEQGHYETLVEAVAAAERAESGSEPDALGQSTKLIDTGGIAQDSFGSKVALSGDTAMVAAQLASGAISKQGAVFVFVRSGTTWVPTQKLVASDGASFDYFGTSVAISGDTAVISSQYADVGANENQGAAYIFVKSGGLWTQQAKVVASDGSPFDWFGIDADISGDTVVVGAEQDSVNGSTNQGSAYVFVRNGNSWAQQQRLNHPGGVVGDRFGNSVAISGETIVAGAKLLTLGGVSNRGAAFVFVRSGTVWSFQQQLISSDGAASDQFGFEVALSGDTAVINTAFTGAVYFFVRGGTSWTQQQRLVVTDGGSRFSGGIAIRGETALLGAAGSQGTGAAYLFVRSGGVWRQTQRLAAAEAGTGDGFGNGVALSDEGVLVGAPTDDIGANADQGSAYVFKILGPNWQQEAAKSASDSTSNSGFGNSVGISGNIAVVGSNLNTVGTASSQGAAYIFVRNGATWTQQQKLLASDGIAGDRFGESVAISSATVVIGATGADPGGLSGRGAAYVFVYNGTLWTQQQKLVAADGLASDNFGYSAAINGETLVIGARLDNVGANTNAGSAYVFVRSGTSWTQQAQLTASNGLANDNFGVSVAIDRDTVVVGAALDDVGANGDQGSAYVFTRSGTTWTQQQQLFGSDSAAGDRFAISVGLSDQLVIVGAFLADAAAGVDQGAAYIFVRSGTVWTQQQKLIAAVPAANDQFGGSVAIDGETAVMGASADDVGANASQGSAYVFERTGTLWTQRALLNGTPGAPFDQFGGSVAISGDKILVGSTLYDNPVADSGAAFFFVNPPSFTLTSAVSRKTHGAAGTFDLPLPLTGAPAVECRSSGGTHTLVFSFTNDIVSGSASLSEGTGSVSGSSVSLNTMTVNLSGVSDVQRITVTLTGVTDSFGQVLPPTAVSVNMLVGDINGSKSVSASDIGSVKAQSGAPVTAVNFRADVAVSGSITATDVGLVKSRSGQSVP